MFKNSRALVTGIFAALLVTPVAIASTPATVKQPVFLICPSTAKNSALSLYVMVDSRDRSKVRSFGIEELSGLNSFGSSYDNVLAAQADPTTRRTQIGVLEARDFGRRQLVVEKDDVLHITLTPRRDGSLSVMCDVRVGSSKRFVIGGKDSDKRAVVLRYDESSESWHAQVEALTDSTGKKVEGAIGRRITGVLFPVASTGIYMVAVAFDDGTGVLLLDR
ncbi:MAG TPA: hypothetical protein VEK08_25565 [Planctomycetota bacterium]|nr:hypothetical protein [Planctomycetota bacterium]